MEREASLIKNISKIKYKERAFEWWGPSPAKAREIQVSKPKNLRDKRTKLEDAVKEFIKDEINIGIGGFVNVRTPIAIVHEIIRHGAKNLTLSLLLGLNHG